MALMDLNGEIVQEPPLFAINGPHPSHPVLGSKSYMIAADGWRGWVLRKVARLLYGRHSNG